MQDSPQMRSPYPGRGDDGRMILVADDDFVVKHLLKEWLAAAGYKCLVANSAEQGWRVIKDFARQIWLVILDIHMPGKYDGIGLLDRIIEVAQIRSLKVSSVAPARVWRCIMRMLPPSAACLLLKCSSDAFSFQVLMISSSQHSIARAVDHGCDEFMTKPMLRPLLLKKVETLKVLSRMEEEREAEDARVAAANTGHRLTIEKLLTFWDSPHSQHIYPSSAVENYMAAKLTDWSFNVFDFSEDQLVVLAKAMFQHLGLVDKCGLRESELEDFILAVRRGYNDNPYHNWRHAFDVTQATFVFMVKYCGDFALAPLEQLALLVAALAHDLAHPGHNNDFLIRTDSDIAALYNHRSVLENCHSFMLFRMFEKRPELNMLKPLSAKDWASAKKTIMECILATDPGLHADFVGKFNAGEATKADTAAHRLLTMQCVLKMADISNVAREWDGPGYSWSALVSQEFFNQGDAMKSSAMEVAPFLDRNATTIGKNSISFIDFVAMPLFKALGQKFPEFDKEVVALLITNRQRWSEESSKI